MLACKLVDGLWSKLLVIALSLSLLSQSLTARVTNQKLYLLDLI